MIIKKIRFLLIRYIFNSNKQKVRHLRKQGAIIGDKTRLLCNISAFGSEPYLIKIGKDCLLTANIHLITHDGGIKVLNSLNYFDGKRMDKMGTIQIGDNVFIGDGSYIMPNVKIGNNVIVGSHSIVTKDVPNNTVVAGIPAKSICTIEEYYNKCKDNLIYVSDLPEKQRKEKILKSIFSEKIKYKKINKN